MHHLAHCSLSAEGRVLDGFVISCADGTLMMRTEPGAAGGAFRAGDDVQVLVLDDVRGEVRYTGWVAKVRATSMQIADLELTSTLQKRKVARVRIAQTCTGVVTSPEGDTRSLTFVVLDISAHGMRVSTTAELAERDRIAFRFPARDRVVALDAEVLRSHRTNGRSTQCGCRFVGLVERDLDTLFRYVLQTQGTQRRTRLRA
ncbi:PilZ domain-containing protein [Cellulomonas humilata]|uniref:PilZ domain-containing protein n=1 Tax=Cellulomonas humilata TaxID=144055 RepID=A0A7Y6A2D9_9CELL|nr:PilZ domain-containing protein [Cellulomonas humilata]NUU17239.1 PilZ domain-containing protein [Cellulomonas humilata]